MPDRPRTHPTPAGERVAVIGVSVTVAALTAAGGRVLLEAGRAYLARGAGVPRGARALLHQHRTSDPRILRHRHTHTNIADPTITENKIFENKLYKIYTDTRTIGLKSITISVVVSLINLTTATLIMPSTEVKISHDSRCIKL